MGKIFFLEDRFSVVNFHFSGEGCICVINMLANIGNRF